MDAAEISRLRERRSRGLLDYGDTGDILDALEQARKERDEARKSYDDTLTRWAELIKNRNDHSRLRAVAEIEREQARKDLDYEKAVSSARFKAVWEAISERDQAQKDAKDARALLEQARHCGLNRDLRARIEAMLEQKP